MAAGHERHAVDLLWSGSSHRPLGDGRRRHAGRHCAGKLVALRDLAKPCRALLPDDPPIRNSERGPIDVPQRRRAIDQHLAGRGRGAGQLWRHSRRRLRSERPLVERDQIGIGHHERYAIERHPQLVGNRLRQRRADVLADLGLAGKAGDVPLLVDVHPCGDVVRRGLLSAAPRFLRRRFRQRRDHEQPTAHGREDAQELAALELEPVWRRFGQLVAFDFDLGIGGTIHRRASAFALRATADRSAFALRATAGKSALPSALIRSAASFTARTMRG